ncbi:hypothetical protein PT974_00936 [Cladobotryum mycophilum]|uniref:Ubiquitin-like domain-containing protein n=1 Tax=Cladobotryum mycophilum TaxID=491253 RepID=A0ABR0T3G5_9HYPO
MSAAAETTMSGGKAVSGDGSQPGQSYDALSTDIMPHTFDASSAQDKSAQNTTTTTTNKDALPIEPLSSTPLQVLPSLPGKAKEEDAPVPPSKDERRESIMAIGPAQDEIKAAPSGPDSGPVCNITLLLTSGSRHPYKLDAKYLRRRNVDIPDKDANGNPDPFSISIYTLKELILREWRSDWEAKPASPSSIRLIHFGKLLDDKEKLKKYQLSPENPNVVHMSIRPQDLDEEEPKSGSKNLPAGHGDGDGVREGRCCVIL